MSCHDVPSFATKHLVQASFQRGFLQRQTFTHLSTKDLIHQLIQQFHPAAIDEEGDQVAEIGQQLQPELVERQKGGGLTNKSLS